MIVKYLNKAGNVEIEYRVLGSKLVGRRFLEISISPEELIEAWDEKDKLYNYLKRLTG